MRYELIKPINNEYSVTEQILTNRGIKYEDIYHYLNTTKEDVLDPELLDNMYEGTQILMSHLKDERKILLIVDSDCDGYCSSALLLNYLYQIAPSVVENKIVYKFHEGKKHGIDLEMLEDDDYGLVICPDSASNDYEQHEELFNKGIDVLVIDHHQAEYTSKYACVINNQLCDYPTKSLCGGGVVYKFCQYMDRKFNYRLADTQIDLVALALIGDMMDIRDFETHELINEGVSRIKNPFFKGMVEKNAYSIGGVYSPINIAFYVVPFINSITRIGTQEEKELLFESMLTWKAYEEIPSTKRGCKGQFESRVEQAVRTCSNIKRHQDKERDDGLEDLEYKILKEGLLDHKVLLIRIEETYLNKNIFGLIANQLMAKYQRPVGILRKVKHDDGQIIWEGSARGYDKSELKDFRTFALDSGLVSMAAGHPNAFGLGIPDETFDAFLEYCDVKLKDISFEPSYAVDFIWSANNFKQRDVLNISELQELWGQQLDEALVAIEGINVTAENIMLMSRDKNPTLKIALPNGVTCIKFRSSEEEYEKLYPNEGCVTINLIGKCQANEFGGMVTPQILINDYEIINRQEYYF